MINFNIQFSGLSQEQIRSKNPQSEPWTSSYIHGRIWIPCCGGTTQSHNQDDEVCMIEIGRCRLNV